MDQLTPPRDASRGSGLGRRQASPGKLTNAKGVKSLSALATREVTLNLKVSAGRESLEDLVRWQSAQLKEKKGKKQPLLLQHVTRLMPKRKDEILDGGSIYWVIKGRIVARQKIVDLKPMQKNGSSYFAIIYEPKLILVARRRNRQIEDWRYLAAKDAPPDIAADKAAYNITESLRVELLELGLL